MDLSTIRVLSFGGGCICVFISRHTRRSQKYCGGGIHPSERVRAAKGQNAECARLVGCRADEARMNREKRAAAG